MELTKEEQKIYKEKLIVTFKAFDKLCKENKLTYFAAGGTALGAVRHNGIIPWDDDIDVLMLRKDYDKLLSLKNSLQETDYRIIDGDDDNYYLTFAKFYDANSSIWEMKGIPCIYGIYIDIFVLDEVEGTLEEIIANKNKYQKLANKYLLSCIVRPWKDVFAPLSHGRVDKFVWYLWQKYLHTQKKSIIRSLIKARTKKGSSSEKWIVAFTGISGGKRDINKPDWFKGTVMHKFEDTEIPLPVNWDAYLSNLFRNYMTPPPVEQQVTHHMHYYFNPNRLVSVEEAVNSTINK